MTADLDRAGLDRAGLWDSLADLDGLRAELAQVTRERDEARAAYLDASAAADLASAGRLDYWADGYRAGFGAGAEVGAGRAIREWKITARNTGRYEVGQHGTTFAELDARRYPAHDGRPAGRVHWLIDAEGASHGR